jgi:hypothetical protein
MGAHRAHQRCEMITIVSPLAGGGPIYRSPDPGGAGCPRNRRVVLHLNGIALPLQVTTRRHCRTARRGIGYQFLLGDLEEVVAEHFPPMRHQSGVGRKVTGQFQEIVTERVAFSKQRPVHREASI